MKIVFATCEQKPLLTADDQLLADALSALGVSVTPIPWTELDPFAVIDSPPIVLRSTWDYHRVPTMFTSWLQALADSGRVTWNPPEVVLGNIDPPAKPKVIEGKHESVDDGILMRYALEVEPGVVVPFLFITPKNNRGKVPVVVMFAQGGKAKFL